MAATNTQAEVNDSIADELPKVDSPPEISPTSDPEKSEVNAASAAEALREPKSYTADTMEASAGTAPEDKDLPPLTKEEMIKEALDCPCIASMKDGPCGTKFLFAYECFLRSESEPKGSNCVDAFVQMHECMNEHPEVYDLDEEENEDPAKLRSAPPRSENAAEKPDMPAPAPEPIQVSSGTPESTEVPPPVPAPVVPEPTPVNDITPEPVHEPEPVIKSDIPQAPPIAAASAYEGYARRALPDFALRQLSRFSRRFFSS